jgi:hypothetical protein
MLHFRLIQVHAIPWACFSVRYLKKRFDALPHRSRDRIVPMGRRGIALRSKLISAYPACVPTGAGFNKRNAQREPNYETQN